MRQVCLRDPDEAARQLDAGVCMRVARVRDTLLRARGESGT